MAAYRSVSAVYEVVYRTRLEDIDYYTQLVAETLTDGHGSVLEVGAGTGRVSLALAKKFPAATFTCVDVDDEALDVLQQNVAAACLTNICIRRADMHELPWEEAFDCVVSPFRVLQHCLTAEDLEKTISSIFRAVKVSGLFAFDLFNPSVPLLSSTGFVAEERLMDTAGVEILRQVHIRQRDLFEQTQLVEEHYEIREQGRDKYDMTWAYSTRYYFRGEVEPLLQKVGFQLVALYGDFKGTPFGAGVYPGDLIFVTMKPH